MTFLHHQRGISFLGFICVAFLAGAVLWFAVTVVPCYLQSYTVNNVLQTLPQDPDLFAKSKRRIKVDLIKRLEVNSIHSISSKDITVKRERKLLTVTVDYQMKRHLIKNIELLLHFRHFVEVSS